MKKEIKAYLEKEYNAIYSGMNVGWKLGLKNKNEELMHNGLDGSGVSQQILTSFATNLIKETNEKIEKLLEKVQKEFNFIMSKEEIKKYIDRSINNDNGYIDMFVKDLEDYFDKKGVLSLAKESIEMHFNNARGNFELSLKRIEERLILINEGQKQNKKEKHKFSRNEIIIGIVIPLIILILSLIFS